MTSTPNPTAEQIVSEALGPYGLIGRARDLAARNAVERLRAHGLLSEGAPSQNETKLLPDFVSLDPEKVAEVLLANAKSRYGGLLFEERAAVRIAHALCEAYTEERLT